VTVTAPGSGPTSIFAATRFVRGSTRDTVPATVCTTQTAPLPAASSLGPFGTSMEAATSFVCGSILASDASAVFDTHTLPSPIAIPPGPPGTGIRATTSPPFGSVSVTVDAGPASDVTGAGGAADAAVALIRVTVFEAKLETHTTGPAGAIVKVAPGSAPGATRIRAPAGSPDRPSMRVTVPSSASVTKT
jgi:hypothetical protein